jgi:hypothetical protein
VGIPQTYYTSCEQGLRGSAGFQTNAATPGLAPDTIATLERLGGYAPPLSAPIQPTAEQIEELPISLVFSRLPDGRAAIGQSRYIGRDYSGRFGNYFSHFLVVADSEFYVSKLIPIMLWRSPIWSTTESAITELSELPTIDRGPISGEELSEFYGVPGRLDRLAQMISAVEKALSGGLRLIVVDQTNSIALWIAGVTACLPHHLAWSTTFTTYTKSPVHAVTLIAGTTVDSDFSFSAFEIEHQYSVFDFVQNRFSPVEASPFGRMAADALRIKGVSAPTSFPDFARKVTRELRLEELAPAFGCHALLRELPRHVSNVDICRWCTAHCQALSAMGSLEAVVAQLSDEPALDMASIQAIQGLFNVASTAGVGRELEEPFLRMLLSVVSTADVAWLGSMPAAVRGVQLPALPETPSAQRDAPVFEIRDPLRLCAAVQLWDALGWLKEREANLLAIGAAVIGGKIQEHAVRTALQNVAGCWAGERLLQGATAALQNLAEQATNFAMVSEVMNHPQCRAVLKREVTKRQLPELAAMMAKYELSEQRAVPPVVFRALLDKLEQHGRSLDSQAAGFAFYLAWGNTHPNSNDCKSILESFAGPTRDRLLQGSGLLQRIAESLVSRHCDLCEGDDQQINTLLNPELRPGLGVLAASLDAIQFLRNSREADPAQTAKLGLEIAGQVSTPLLPKVLKKAVASVARIEHPQSHQARLESSLKTYGEAAATIYAESMEGSFEEKLDVDRLLRLARGWLRIRSKGEPAGAAVINKAFAQVNQLFDKSARAAIKSEMAKGTDGFAARWDEIIQTKSGGLFGMFRRGR